MSFKTSEDSACSVGNGEYRRGFDQKRIVVLPSNVIRRCRHLPFVRNLYITNIGSLGASSTHRVERDAGVKQAILQCCIQGRGFLEMQDNVYTIRAGNAIFIPPGLPHFYGAHKRDPWANFWFHFDGPLVGEVLERFGVDSLNPTIFFSNIEELQGLFEDVYACLNYHHSDTGLMRMNSEFIRFLGLLELNRVHQFQQSRNATDKIEETIRFMESNLNTEFDLDHLAQLADKSKSHYCKIFKERTGESPVSFFIRIKVRKACEMLDHSDMSIRDIGNSLGYKDPYYFSRAFKKVQGVSPEIYRKTIKG